MTELDYPVISVCVASIRANTLPFLVDSIVAQSFQNWELIVAVQGDQPGLIPYLTQQVEKDDRISFIHLDRFGRSYALNQAVMKARGGIIAFTDDDCVAAPDWLETIYSCFSTDDCVGIVAGDLTPSRQCPFTISTCPATFTIEYLYRPKEMGYSAPHGFYWGGANFAVRNSVMKLVGPFDEYVGPGTEFAAAEDVDFCLRAELMGVVMWTTPKSVIYHTHGRRYGLWNFLKYHRTSAFGSGALNGKLFLLNHRLIKTWGVPKKILQLAIGFLKNPFRTLLDQYKFKYQRIGMASYLSKFDIDSQVLSFEKTG